MENNVFDFSEYLQKQHEQPPRLSNREKRQALYAERIEVLRVLHEIGDSHNDRRNLERRLEIIAGEIIEFGGRA